MVNLTKFARSSDWMLINIVLKDSFFETAIWENNSSYSMLDSFHPLALVYAAICPQHLAVAMSFVFWVVTLVNVTRSPSEHALSMLHFIYIIAIILVAVLMVLATLPFCFAMLLTFKKVTYVKVTVFPSVLSFSVWFSVLVVSVVCLSVCKSICALSMLETHVPLAFVPITIWPCMHAISVSLWVMPFTNIRVLSNSFPDTISLF